MASANTTLTLRNSKSSPGKNSSIDVVVLNFHENPEDINLPTKFANKMDFKMLLSSGDWVINGITNIDANPDYDIHVCLPEPASTPNHDPVDPLQANIHSILGNNKFMHTKLICYVDYLHPVEIREFCRVFKNRVSQLGTLDNRILPETTYILELLADGGRVIWNLASIIETKNATILRDNFDKVERITKQKGRFDYVKKSAPHHQSNSGLEGDSNINKKTNISRKKSGNKNTNFTRNNQNSGIKSATNKNKNRPKKQTS